MKRLVISAVALLMGFALTKGETVFVQDGWAFGRSGEYLRLFSIVIDQNRGIEVYYIEDGCCGNTILHKELLTVHEDLPIPAFLVTRKANAAEATDEPLLPEVFEGTGRIGLYRLGFGLLEDVQNKVLENIPEWIEKKGLSWVYSKEYPWVYIAGLGWIYVVQHGVINLPGAENSLFLERSPDEFYNIEQIDSYFYYPRYGEPMPEIYYADTAYYGYSLEHGWIWFRDAFLPWIHVVKDSVWIMIQPVGGADAVR